MTDAEFAPYAWHDDVIHGLRMRIGRPEMGDWQSELVLDIDHIVEWPCPGDNQFKIVPATLTFHDVGDLSISIDGGDTGGQVALCEGSIDHIAREVIRDQKACLDRAYYRWRIELNWPKGGRISFASSGFTQALQPGAPSTARL